MIPGPNRILSCSWCSGMVSLETITSGNTFGAKHWSDGKCLAPMLPESYALMKCPHCAATVWVGDLETIGWLDVYRDIEMKYDRKRLEVQKRTRGEDIMYNAMLSMFEKKFNDSENAIHEESKIRFASAKMLVRPTTGDLQGALHNGSIQNERELYIRVRLWWEWNDDRRNGQFDKPLEEIERINLGRLIALLDDSTNDSCIMKAEALRELGKYNEAITLLSRPFNKNFDVTVSQILQLAVSGDSQLAEIKHE